MIVPDRQTSSDHSARGPICKVTDKKSAMILVKDRVFQKQRLTACGAAMPEILAGTATAAEALLQEQ